MADRKGAFEFMEGFVPDDRELFTSAAERVLLRKGQYLLRRGEPGGDVYLLKSGTLEVVDSRSTPEVILAVLKPGATVGEMAFVDDSPRSADVRAGADAEVLRWSHDDLRSLLQKHPRLSAAFYESVARIASARLRTLTEGAVSGAVTSREGASQAGLQRARETARTVTERAKARLLEVDSRLRHDPGDRDAAALLVAGLDDLQQQVARMLVEHGDPEEHAIVDELLSRELHPYLVRSALAERCIGRPQGVTGTADIMAHVLEDRAAGDGVMGEVIDRWLLDRPTLAALRSFHAPTVEVLRDLLPNDRYRNVLVLNAGSGHLVALLASALTRPPTVLAVVDQSRDLLAVVEDRLRTRGDVQTYQENLAQFALGKPRHEYPAQDAVVVHGLVEYLPERIAVSLLMACRQVLRPARGTVIVSALAPSEDMGLLDHLLDWPTVRRSEEALRNVFVAAGLRPTARAEVPSPGVLLVGGVTTR